MALFDFFEGDMGGERMSGVFGDIAGGAPGALAAFGIARMGRKQAQAQEEEQRRAREEARARATENQNALVEESYKRRRRAQGASATSVSNVPVNTGEQASQLGSLLSSNDIPDLSSGSLLG